MSMSGLSSWDTEPAQWYRYNGKERDTLSGWTDFGARWGILEIGRWHGVDPLVGNYVGWSPFCFTLDNPVRLVDPDGRSVESTHLDEDGKIIAVIEDGDNGVYQHKNGITASEITANQYYGAANKGLRSFPSAGGLKINEGVTITSTKSGFLINDDGSYTHPAGPSPFQITETTWVSGGDGVVASLGRLEVTSINDVPENLKGSLSTGTSGSIGAGMGMPIEVMSATKGMVIFDQSVTGSSLEEMFSGANFVRTRSVSALLKYTDLKAFDNIGGVRPIFHAKMFGGGVATAGVSGSDSVVEFKKQ